MAIKVSVYGADKDSDEYNAALKLKKIFKILRRTVQSEKLFCLLVPHYMVRQLRT